MEKAIFQLPVIDRGSSSNRFYSAPSLLPKIILIQYQSLLGVFIETVKHCSALLSIAQHCSALFSISQHCIICIPKSGLFQELKTEIQLKICFTFVINFSVFPMCHILYFGQKVLQVRSKNFSLHNFYLKQRRWKTLKFECAGYQVNPILWTKTQ